MQNWEKISKKFILMVANYSNWPFWLFCGNNLQKVAKSARKVDIAFELF